MEEIEALRLEVEELREKIMRRNRDIEAYRGERDFFKSALERIAGTPNKSWWSIQAEEALYRHRSRCACGDPDCDPSIYE